MKIDIGLIDAVDVEGRVNILVLSNAITTTHYLISVDPASLLIGVVDKEANDAGLHAPADTNISDGRTAGAFEPYYGHSALSASIPIDPGHSNPVADDGHRDVRRHGDGRSDPVDAFFEVHHRIGSHGQRGGLIDSVL